MSTTVFAISALASIAFLVVESLAARAAGMFTVRQMRASYPDHRTYLPFLWHFGMWNDLLLITPLVSILVGTFYPQWEWHEITLALVGGTAVSVVFHLSYATSPIPDSLIWRGGVTPAGYLHFVYTALALAVFGLFFFATEQRGAAMTGGVALVLAFHLTLSGKVFLGLLNRFALRLKWCPTLIGDWQQWAILVVGYVVLATIAVWPIG